MTNKENFMSILNGSQLLEQYANIPNTDMSVTLSICMERKDGAILTWKETLGSRRISEIIAEQRKRAGSDVKFLEIEFRFTIDGKYYEFPIDAKKFLNIVC